MENRYHGGSPGAPANTDYHAGLEVAGSPPVSDLEVQSPHSGPFLAPDNNHRSYYSSSYSNPGTAAGETTPYSKTSYPDIPPQQVSPTIDDAGGSKKSNRSRLWFIAGAVAAVIIAGLVSGIVGWQVTKANSRNRIAELESQLGLSGGGEGGDQCAPRQDDTSNAERILQRGSFLSTTGTFPSAAKEDFEMRVYYQAPNGGSIYYSLYNTYYKVWSRPIAIGPTGSDGAPMVSAPMSASVSLGDGLRPVPWDNLLYVTNGGLISMRDWGPGYPTGGTVAETFTKQQRKIASKGQIAYLWPHTVYEDTNSNGATKFTHVLQSYKVKNFTDMSVEPVSGISAGTGIVALPLTKEFKAPELRLVYRTRDGHIGIFDRDINSKTKETDLSSVSIPDGAPMAGFSVLQEPSGTTLMSKILFRGSDNKIQIMTQTYGRADLTENNHWEGPTTDEVFDKADSDTRISCLMAAMATYPGVARSVLENYRMSYCFFQEGGKLKQVHFDGAKWNTIGFVPMPM